jgi:hypothetical protein
LDSIAAAMQSRSVRMPAMPSVLSVTTTPETSFSIIRRTARSTSVSGETVISSRAM